MNSKARVCKDCKVSKPLKEFAVSKTCSDGHAWVCHKCRYQRMLLSQRRERWGMITLDTDLLMRRKTCSKCGVVKPFSDYHRQKRGKYGLRAICKACGYKQSKEYRPEGLSRGAAYYRKKKKLRK